MAPSHSCDATGRKPSFRFELEDWWNGQTNGWLLNRDDDYLGFSSSCSHLLDVVVKVMGDDVEGVVLSQKMQREADRLLAQIVRADSMIIAVKAGARADGFVLGLETGGALRAGDAENLYIIFEAALVERLKTLTKG
ncbi:hypothetical protein PHLH6_31100 [Pseudomonas sp. Seg1]|uniref:hypothetical protein n=1 Tax=Pseudomonas sp. Seg1 TaxID=2678259 RepID=UPI001BEE3214|nr:hypothetical protein [Pseudomonas sp. Seg1]BBP71106.1 hypothetical protein PHLH6_31100 [Pseudomonas sp. Seg1]